MGILPVKLVKMDQYKGVVCQCYHCGGDFGTPNGVCAQFCHFCKKAEQRVVMDQQNKEINPDYQCLYCIAEAEEKRQVKIQNAIDDL